MPIRRNRNATPEGRAFLLSIFRPGLEIAWSEVLHRAALNEIPCSPPTLNHVAVALVTEGELERVSKGIYRRVIRPTKPETSEPPPPATLETLAAGLRELNERMSRMEARLYLAVPKASPTVPLLPAVPGGPPYFRS